MRTRLFGRYSTVRHRFIHEADKRNRYVSRGPYKLPAKRDRRLGNKHQLARERVHAFRIRTAVESVYILDGQNIDGIFRGRGRGSSFGPDDARRNGRINSRFIRRGVRV